MKTTWYKSLFMHLIWAVHMSFGSDVVITRFNRRKERVTTMMGISHFTKSVYVGIICNCLYCIYNLLQNHI